MNKKHKEVNVTLSYRNTESTEAISKYAQDKIKSCVKKFVHNDTDVTMVLSVEKNRHIAEVTFHSGGADFSCTQESDNMYASIDALVDSLGQQLRKHKERLTKHH